jgi:hypothetical protein
MKNLHKLLKGEHILGLTNVHFEKDRVCSACQAGKQVGVHHPHKNIMTIDRPLELLHMDLFGPIAYISIGGSKYLSAFRTREVRQPTSEFVAACPCPDGLMQDGTQEGNEAYVIMHRGARSRGYKRRERARARARERERVPACVRLCLSRLPRLPLCRRALSSMCVHVNECQRVCVSTSPLLGRPWTSPFIDTRRCPAVQWGVAMC